jgi:hypothetical protein
MAAQTPSGRAALFSGAVLAVGLLACLVLAFSSASRADTQFIDGDIGNNTPNLMYGAGHNDCSTRGTDVAAALKLHYDGNPNDPSAHFGPVSAVSLSFADRDNGNGNHAALAAGITATPSGSPTIPSTWNNSTQYFNVPFTVNVPSTIPDGVYQLEVSASGTNGNNGPYSPTGGRPLFIIHIACSDTGGGGGGGGNSAPTVGDINGASSASEGDTKAYSITATDPDNDPLSISWSVTGGSAEFLNNVNTGSSVSLHFTDGPSTVELQAEVSDGHNPAVTKTLTIDELNVAPTVAFTSGDTAVTESTSAHTYAYSISDPGDDTETGNPSCGSLGTLSSATNSATGGSFDCTFLDGLKPAIVSDVSVSATDSDTDTGNTAHLLTGVTVSNVAPVIASLSLTGNNAVACIGGNSVGLSFTFSDAGTIDNPWGYAVNWGDTSSSPGSSATQGSTGPISHSYGAGAYTPGVTVTDKDGDSGDSSSLASPPTVSLLYSTGQGILQPINYTGPRSLFKLGSTIPVKIKITDCNGASVSTLRPQVSLVKLDSNPDGTSPEDVYSTVPDQGTTMRFTGSPDYQYIYNLATKTLSAGDFKITISDPTIASVTAYFSIKK